MDQGRNVWVRFASANEDRHADRLLVSAEEPCGHRRLVTFRCEVDEPSLISGLAKVLPHAREARAGRKSRRADESDDASRIRRMRIEGFPGRPSPEVNVLVRKHILQAAVARFLERVKAWRRDD